MNKGQEHAYKILEKIFELQEAFDNELNSHNPIYEEYLLEGTYPDSIMAQLAEDEEFIHEYLYDKAMDLIKTVLTATWYGKYVAGFFKIANSYEEYRKIEQEEKNNYFHNLNETIKGFEDKMNEWKKGII